MFTKFSLKTKLLALCLALSSISAVVGVTGIISQQKVSYEYDFIVHKIAPKASYAGSFLANYRKLRINITMLGIAGISPKEAEHSISIAHESIRDYDKSNEAYVALQFVPGQKELYDKVDSEWSAYKEVANRLMSLYQSGTTEDKDKMMKILLQELPGKAVTYTAAVNSLLEFHDSAMEKRSNAAAEISESANRFSVGMVIGGVLAALIFGYFFANSLAKSLNRISESVLIASEQTSSGGAQLAAASVQLSSGSTEAAASLEETVASIEELSSMVRLNTGHAQEANVLSQKSHEAASQGEVEISKLISSMADIAAGSKKIEEIINVIDDIAFQTNLLALNAAVEAARAGEQGKGFAVVAEAVRGLALRSAVAAKDISSLINENVTKSEMGAKTASASGVVLKDILIAVKKVADLNSEIATGSQEQANGLEQITKAMNQLDQATQGNAASSEEVAASSEEMSQQANALSELVGDLQRLVQGNSGSGARTETSVMQKYTPAPSKPKLKVAPFVAKVASKPKGQATSVIPFDDDSEDRKIGNVSGF